MQSNTEIIEQMCILSRQGVCLMDMQQVVEAAQALNLNNLAALVRGDLESRQIVDGAYFPIVQSLIVGVQP